MNKSILKLSTKEQAKPCLIKLLWIDMILILEKKHRFKFGHHIINQSPIITSKNLECFYRSQTVDFNSFGSRPIDRNI